MLESGHTKRSVRLDQNVPREVCARVRTYIEKSVIESEHTKRSVCSSQNILREVCA